LYKWEAALVELSMISDCSGHVCTYENKLCHRCAYCVNISACEVHVAGI